MIINRETMKGATLLVLCYFFMAGTAHATGTGLPWDDRITAIVTSVQGDVARGIGTIAIVVTGLAMAFGDMGNGMKKLLAIVFGLSVAFTASSFFLGFFNFTGGATF